MLPRERCDYSAIVDRPPLKLPGDARLAFWTIVNYEVWDIGRPMPRQVLPAPTGVPLLPDVPHWSWHEYGMRVGAWRFFELYERLGIRPTLAINARTCEDYTRVAKEAKRLRWEFMGHAYDQVPIHKVEDQAAMINRSMDILERFSGKRPVGWLGPGLTQTLETPELLVSAGVKYIGDWVYDDEPTVIRTAKGPLVTLPYTVEINDIALMIVQHHESDYLARRAIDQFDRPLRRGKEPRQDHGAGDPPLYQRPTAPHQIPRSDLRSCAPLRGRAALERRRNPRLVSRRHQGRKDGVRGLARARPNATG
jgi:allantoinase